MIDTLLFTSWLKVLLPATHRQGHVCGSEEMHEHVNRRGAGRQVRLKFTFNDVKGKQFLLKSKNDHTNCLP